MGDLDLSADWSLLLPLANCASNSSLGHWVSESQFLPFPFHPPVFLSFLSNQCCISWEDFSSGSAFWTFYSVNLDIAQLRWAIIIDLSFDWIPFSLLSTFIHTISGNGWVVARPGVRTPASEWAVSLLGQEGCPEELVEEGKKQEAVAPPPKGVLKAGDQTWRQKRAISRVGPGNALEQDCFFMLPEPVRSSKSGIQAGMNWWHLLWF